MDSIVPYRPLLTLDPDVRFLTAIAINVALIVSLGSVPAFAQESMIASNAVAPASYDAAADRSSPAADQVCDIGDPRSPWTPGDGAVASAELRRFSDTIRVGYDDGFVLASLRERNLETDAFPFRLKVNGWGQLRHTASDVALPNTDLNQFQMKRARLILSGNAFLPDLNYFTQFDGRSSSGDNMRLLDFYLNYDIGHAQFGFEKGTFGFRAGKYKMPFTMARWLSGKEFEFSDRSVASTYFDVNRSLAIGLFGQSKHTAIPIEWETAIFNGFVTGGAETGSSGNLDDNFAYSIRLQGYPIGDWGSSQLADFESHDRLAMRVGCAFAGTTISRNGSTEFNTPRVVDSGQTFASILPVAVDSYHVAQFAVDTSFKWRGWSTTMEYYFRNLSDFEGAALPSLLDHGFWFQVGYFVVPEKLQVLTRWSRVDGDSGTLGASDQSTDEVGAGLAWYLRGNRAKLVTDVTRLDGAPISSSALDVNPGDRGWLFRTQMQFSF
ncbi:Phosphate-selective porin O and P [Rosistilla ulvae]|uniref:Phosphate-selective porin O and P n=1 Tax=Rosistilla ulvae TaxID=1930277 RepID=A0A517M0H4_9BACT|nr:porin [Rosistilla ulvae]QDS88380.1 Phosphate-selective porin O and P [Rosistilla ulvae]